ncbi:MAG: ABC transporter permease [Actinomycetota bacterium]|nr:ABC transporter permease [Actinomycetota bacterium]MDQ3390758.1 ABC transporter permease [Actinomycetota bacterium]
MTIVEAGLQPGLASGRIDPPSGRRGVLVATLGLWRTRIGLLLVAVLVGIAVIGPLFAPYGGTEFVGPPFTADAPDTLFGTDKLGQDVWSRFLLGGRTILLLAVVSTLIGLAIGAVVGLVAAYNRGRLDNVLMRTMDVVFAFPNLLLALVAVTTLGRRSWVIVLIVAFTAVPRVARITRGAALGVVERDFIGAAEALGESRSHILGREILPNVAGPLLVEANLRLTYSIALIGALGFLGFGVGLNQPDWAQMINENRPALSTAPWGTLLPIFAIALLTVGVGLVADGLGRAIAGVDRARPT